MWLFPEWMSHLPLQQQAVLVMASRGPDGFKKYHKSKPILYFYRACIMRAAHTGLFLETGERCQSYMSMELLDPDLWAVALSNFSDVEDELPLHYYTHLMHGAEILAYKHPDALVRFRWMMFYGQCCKYLHCPKETRAEMDARLNDFGREGKD